YTALSNMPAMSTRTIDSQWKETQFETTPIMSTYLVAIVVSDLKPRNFTFDSDYKKYE
ncbi:aminopeptidase, partial [Biomphalaria glabrata]